VFFYTNDSEDGGVKKYPKRGQNTHINFVVIATFLLVFQQNRYNLKLMMQKYHFLPDSISATGWLVFLH